MSKQTKSKQKKSEIQDDELDALLEQEIAKNASITTVQAPAPTSTAEKSEVSISF